MTVARRDERTDYYRLIRLWVVGGSKQAVITAATSLSPLLYRVSLVSLPVEPDNIEMLLEVTLECINLRSAALNRQKT